MSIVGQVLHLHREGGIVGQHPKGVVINFKSVFYGFDGDGLVLVCDDPVQLWF